MTAAPSEHVRNLVTRPPVLVHLDDSLRKVAQFFVEESIGAAVVRGRDPPAIISERDIVRAVADGLNLDRTRVEEVMTEDVALDRSQRHGGAGRPDDDRQRDPSRPDHRGRGHRRPDLRPRRPQVLRRRRRRLIPLDAL